MNLLQYSEEFQRWSLVQGATVASNGMLAPNGSLTADRLTDSALGAQPRILSNGVITNGGPYVFSVYLKSDTLQEVTLALRLSGILIRIATFPASTTWRRVALATLTSPVAGSALVAEIYPGKKGGESGSVLIWGAQVETGLVPSAYQPTGTSVNTSPVTGPSRGYLTTPQELAAIKLKANGGVEPYRSAVAGLLAYVGATDYWPYGVVDPLMRDLFQHAAALVYAKGLAYHLTGNPGYAASAREKILQISVTATGARDYSGGNGNILTLGRQVPGYIFAADLIASYSDWSRADKSAFQRWLAVNVYDLVDWASDTRSTNWGSACSACTAIIADYLSGSNLYMMGRDGTSRTASVAFAEARQKALDRANGNVYMYNSVCSDSRGLGIRPDGGIPEELGRGSTGCGGLWLLQADDSYSYMMTHLSGAVLHAELLLRRGDRSLFDNLKANGGGSILRAIRFVIANPHAGSLSWPWQNSRKSILEIAYRYYRDVDIARQLGIGTLKRNLDRDDNSSFPHFGTLTHGFGITENPGAPPVAPLPV